MAQKPSLNVSNFTFDFLFDGAKALDDIHVFAIILFDGVHVAFQLIFSVVDNAFIRIFESSWITSKISAFLIGVDIDYTFYIVG